MIKAKPSFLWTSESEGHGCHGNKSTILFLGSINVPMSVISINIYIWLVEVVNTKKQLSVSKKFCFKYRISMIKVKLSFFWTSNSGGHGSHGNKFTILSSGQANFAMSVISSKLYFVKIGWGHQKLCIFNCTMLKTLNSDFLDLSVSIELLS